MKGIFFAVFFIFVVYLNCFAIGVKRDVYTGVITTDSVNVRSGPSLNFEIIMQMDKGSLVLVEDESKHWYKIRIPRNCKAYVHKDFLELDINDGSYGIISGDSVNVRAGKGLHFNILGQLNNGSKVMLAAKEGDWYRIFSDDNCYAWVNRDFVKDYGNADIYWEHEKSAKKIENLFESAIETERKAFVENDEQVLDLNVPIHKYQSIAKKYPDSAYAKAAKHKANSLKEINVQGNVLDSIRRKLHQRVEAEGKLVDAGRLFSNKATHKLIKGKKVIYYLKSNTLNLNDFIYYKVRVSGELRESAKSKVSAIIVDHIEKLN